MYSVEEKTQAVIEWLLFKTYGVAKVEKYKQDCTNNLNAATLLDSDVDQVTDDTDEEELVIPNILQAKPKPGNMPPAELCFAMYHDREPLGSSKHLLVTESNDCAWPIQCSHRTPNQSHEQH